MVDANTVTDQWWIQGGQAPFIFWTKLMVQRAEKFFF